MSGPSARSKARTVNPRQADSTADEIAKLKAECYDLLVLSENVQNALRAKNQRIAELQASVTTGASVEESAPAEG